MRDLCNDIAVLEIDNKETKKNAKEAWAELMILLDILFQLLEHIGLLILLGHCFTP